MEHVPIQSYRDLTAWRKSVELVVEIYRVSRAMPEEERFGLVPQTRCAAVSIAANIAEGHGSSHKKTFLRHLTIARGSLMETECLLELAVRLEMVKEHDLGVARIWCDDVSRLLTSLIRAISRSTGPRQH